jgi:hypothetical protein
MRFAFPTRLGPLAGAVFTLGVVAGWSSVTLLRGCVGVELAEPVARAGEPAAPVRGAGAEASADSDPPNKGEDAPEPAADDAAAGVAREVPAIPERVPRGRAIAALAPEACFELLDALGVTHDRSPKAVADATEGVKAPVRLTGALAGVTYGHVGRSATHELVDCRLAVALLRWAPALRAAGVRHVAHMSAFRPGARVNNSARPSGHATALAMDAARFERDDGTVLDVFEDWTDKARGASPCDAREDEPEPQAVLRDLVCAAVTEDLFQVVITPHHNQAHHNHVHLEVVPDVDWSYIR